MNRRVIPLLTLSLLAAFAAGACGDDDPGTNSDQDSTPANTLRVVETDYAFEVTGEPTGGTVTIEVENRGSELHEVAFSKLVDGKTYDDAKAALDAAADDDREPLKGIVEDDNVIDDIGSAQAPGTALSVSGPSLDAGEYVLMCFIPNAEGVSHYELGMIAPVTIAEGSSETSAEADVTYTATDEKLDGPKELAAGETTIEVVNDTATTREITLLKLAAGKTAADIGAFFESAGEGVPDFANGPFEFFTFVFDSDADRTVTVDLTPGQWAIQAPDPENQFEGPPTEDPHGIFFTVS